MMETGGIESHLREFCLRLSAEVEVDLVILNSDMSAESEAYFKSLCGHTYFGKVGRSYLRFFWLLMTALSVRKFKYDAVYTNGQGNSVGLFMLFLGRSAKWVHHHHMAGDAKDQKTWTSGYVKTLKEANLVIACSKKNALDMEAPLNREIDTIPCFSREIHPISSALANTTTVKFGYYGRLIPEKGIDHLCQLSEEASLSHVEFHIWGEGSAYPSAYFDKYKKVIYHGTFKGEAELAKVIGSIDAFLLLSVHPEGLPICLLEAMSAGLPWLATDKGGITDIASDPMSTRVISAEADYKTIKSAVELFAADIRDGKLSKDTQKQLYHQKFSAKALTSRWMYAFGLK
jgi:glycosyltransferase involved in cell wall biosynthesis